jgi:hypothetical protein
MYAEKREFLLVLRQQADETEALGGVAEGARWLHAQLLARLDAARETLLTLKAPGGKADPKVVLPQLADLLTGGQWDMAQGVLDDLTQQEQDQRTRIRGYLAVLQQWQGQIDRLRTALGEAERSQAPVTREKDQVAKLADVVKKVETAFGDRDFNAEWLDDLSKAMEQLDVSEKEEPASKLLARILEKTEKTAEFAGQADLVLLRSERSNKGFKYNVLLRTPRRSGLHGIDIQDTSTLGRYDHNQFQKLVDELTNAINQGLRSAFNARQAAGAAPDGGADATRQIILTSVAGASTGEAAVRRSANDVVRSLGDRMYAMVIPEEMRRYLEDTPCTVTIRTNDLLPPWELMCWRKGTEIRFLCLDRPVARMPLGRAFPRRDRGVDRTGEKLRFLLVHADPYGNLPAAGKEVEQIEEGLRKQWGQRIDLVKLGPKEALGERLNDELREGAFDVIHYAGHAAFDRREPDLSGLLLQRNEVFFAQKVRRLLEGRPLVFLNACESGRTADESKVQVVSQSLQRPAEGLASAFIYGGAAGCIGALWPVYDLPAAKFAIDFYNYVIEGHMIGEAMRRAREDNRTAYQDQDQITWASFMLYGDPTYQLR